MPDTIYMISHTRYWSGVQPENFASDAAGIERIVRQRYERLYGGVKSIEVDMATRIVAVQETDGRQRTYHILVVERI